MRGNRPQGTSQSPAAPLDATGSFNYGVIISRLGIGRSWTPWLLIRYTKADAGDRPVPAAAAFYLSPDIWVESSDPNGNAVPGRTQFRLRRDPQPRQGTRAAHPGRFLLGQPRGRPRARTDASHRNRMDAGAGARHPDRALQHPLDPGVRERRARVPDRQLHQSDSRPDYPAVLPHPRSSRRPAQHCGPPGQPGTDHQIHPRRQQLLPARRPSRDHGADAAGAGLFPDTRGDDALETCSTRWPH